MRKERDFSYSSCRYCVWEVGLTIHGFKLLLVQYVDIPEAGTGKELVIYLLGAGGTLRWGKKEN